MYWAWSLAGVIACGGGPQQPSGAISADGLADAIAEAFCSSIEGCCHAAGFRYDAAACRRAQRLRFEPLVDGKVTSAGVRYDPNAAFRCVEVIRTRSCSFGPSIGGGPCDDMFVGLRKPGERCSRSEECARASEGYTACDLALDGASMCVVRPDALAAMRGKAGDKCFASCREWIFAGQPASACGLLLPPPNSGAACFWNDGVHCKNGTCAPLEPIGGECFSVDSCSRGAYCGGSSITSTGTCRAELGVGGDCSADPHGCGDSSYCEQQVCRSRKAAGESCSSEQECSFVPCDLGKCVGPAPVLASVCAG